MPSILQVVNAFPPEAAGGADLYAARLTEALARTEPVRVVAGTRRPHRPAGEATTEEKKQVKGQVTVTRINRTYAGSHFADPWKSAACEEAFERVLESAAPQIVHFHHLTGLSLGLPPLARAAGARTVYTLHDYWLPCQRGQLVDRRLHSCEGPGIVRCARCWPGPGAPWLPRRILGFRDRRRDLHRALAAIDVFVAPAERIAGWFEAWAKRESLSLRVVREGYGMPPLEAPREPRDGRLRLAFLGSMMFTKGVHVVLEALIESEADVEIHCHGGVSDYHEIGGYEEYLESLRLRAPDRIVFHGPYEPDRLPPILGSIDGLCCPSLWPENSPLVVHEALQAGVPVLGSDCGGIPELVPSGKHGFLLPPGDTQAWSKLLTKLADDPGILRNLVVDGSRVAGLAEHTERIRRLYSDLLAGRPRIR